MVEVGAAGQLVEESLPDVHRVLEGQLLQRPGLLPLLHARQTAI